jgi:CubicO group peptidase (beta-lactamase class C family)
VIAALVLATSMDAIFRDYDGKVPGASVLVIRDGEVVFRKSYGLADVEAGTPATPETNYRLASMTKQFTAMAVLGLRILDDPITRFFPELPEHGITVRQLLTHTSGLVDYEDVIPAGTSIPLKDFDVLWLLTQQEKTLFPPGTQWRYSNSGYALLALIVEKVSGQTFARFLHDNLFVPAGMKSTVAYEKGLSTIAHRAYGYSGAVGFSAPNPWRRTDQSLTSAVLGDGGIYSSIDDLARWIAWLDRNSLDRDATTPHAKTPDASYGYGWFIGEKRGHRAIWHTGETIGFRNAVLRLPDEKLTVIILTNRNDGHPIELALDVAAACAGRL